MCSPRWLGRSPVCASSSPQRRGLPSEFPLGAPSSSIQTPLPLPAAGVAGALLPAGRPDVSLPEAMPAALAPHPPLSPQSPESNSRPCTPLWIPTTGGGGPARLDPGLASLSSNDSPLGLRPGLARAASTTALLPPTWQKRTSGRQKRTTDTQTSTRTASEPDRTAGFAKNRNRGSN